MAKHKHSGIILFAATTLFVKAREITHIVLVLGQSVQQLHTLLFCCSRITVHHILKPNQYWQKDENQHAREQV